MKKTLGCFLSGQNIKENFIKMYGKNNHFFVKLFVRRKIKEKVWSIFVGQKFTESSDESEVSLRGENSSD